MDESLIKKVQPHSKEAEQSVIGSMIMDKDAIQVFEEYASKASNTPFTGWELDGVVCTTICDGKIVFSDEEAK